MNRRWELEEYLSGFEHLYPGILKWCAGILSEVRTGRRSILGVIVEERLSGLAVTKNSRSAKLCHISLDERLQHKGLGLDLAHLAVDTMLSSGARNIRVTTSEEVAALHGRFFSRLGFSPTAQQRGVYRPGCYEMVWEASRWSLARKRVYRVKAGCDYRPAAPSLDSCVAKWSGSQWEPLLGIPLPLTGVPDDSGHSAVPTFCYSDLQLTGS